MKVCPLLGLVTELADAELRAKNDEHLYENGLSPVSEKWCLYRVRVLAVLEHECPPRIHKLKDHNSPSNY